MNFISVFVTVWTISLHYRSPKTHPAPSKWIQYLFFRILPVVFLMRRPQRYQKSHQFTLRSLSVPRASLRNRNRIPRGSRSEATTEDFADDNLIELQELTAQTRRRSNNPRKESLEADEFDLSSEMFQVSTRCFEALEVITDSYRRTDYIRQVKILIGILSSKTSV